VCVNQSEKTRQIGKNTDEAQRKVKAQHDVEQLEKNTHELATKHTLDGNEQEMEDVEEFVLTEDGIVVRVCTTYMYIFIYI